MKEAESLRSIADKAREEADQSHLKLAKELIDRAYGLAKNGEYEMQVYDDLPEKAKSYLKAEGFKIASVTHRNETTTTISW